MAITRLWQAGAESDTTSSVGAEFDSKAGAFVVSAAQKKSGSYAYFWNTNDDYGVKAITATRQIRIGFWWYVATSAETATMLMSACAAAIGTVLVQLRPYGSSQTGLSLYTGGTLRDSSINLGVTTGTWAHVGMDMKVDNAAGWAKVYVNGKEKLSYTGNTGNTDIENVVVGNPSGGGSWNEWTSYVDDIYVDDTTGEAAAAVPDLRFEPIVPDGDGNHTDWDEYPGSGEDHYEDVDERPNDGDTTYVEAQVLDERDTYTMTTYTMAAGWSIQAVIPFAMAKKTDGGTATQIAMATRQGGVDDTGSDQDLPTSYGLVYERFTTDPGGGAWSQADLDSVEVGVVGRGTF